MRSFNRDRKEHVCTPTDRTPCETCEELLAGASDMVDRAVDSMEQMFSRIFPRKKPVPPPTPTIRVKLTQDNMERLLIGKTLTFSVPRSQDTVDTVPDGTIEISYPQP